MEKPSTGGWLAAMVKRFGVDIEKWQRMSTYEQMQTKKQWMLQKGKDAQRRKLQRLEQIRKHRRWIRRGPDDKAPPPEPMGPPDPYQEHPDIPKQVQDLGPGAVQDYRVLSLAVSQGIIKPDTATETLQKRMGYRYGQLPSEKQETYAAKYTDWETIPVGERKHYTGSKHYFEYMSPEDKQRLMIEYTKSGGQLSEATLQFGLDRTIPIKQQTKQKIWETITMTDPQIQKAYWKKTDLITRISHTTGTATIGAFLFPVTLSQSAIKYFTGEQVGPDISRWLMYKRGYGPPGLIGMTISETIGAVTGKPSGEFPKVVRSPLESIGATAGEIAGMFAMGKTLHIGKTLTYKGLHKARIGAMRYTGTSIPGYEQISYYFPQRIFRRWWVRKGISKIDDLVEKPFHSMDTLTPRGLSFAPGKTPSQRITWTIGKTRETIPVSKTLQTGDDFLLTASSGGRVGRSFTIKPETIHELPAMSTTPYGYAPTRFYRFGTQNLQYSTRTTLFPRLHLPTGVVTPVKRVYDVFGRTYDDITRWASRQPKGEWAVIGPKMKMGGPEIELNIFGLTRTQRFLPTSTKLWHRLRGYQYYTEVPLSFGKSEFVPVVFTRPIHMGYPTGAKLILGGKTMQHLKTFLPGSSSMAGSSTSVISYKYLISQGFKSSIRSTPSKPFSMPSISIMTSRFFSGPSRPSGTSIVSTISTTKPSTFKSYLRSVSSMPSGGSIGSFVSKLSGPSLTSGVSKTSTPRYMTSMLPYDTEQYFPPLYWKTKRGRLLKPKLDSQAWDLGYRFRMFNIPDLDKLIRRFHI